MRSLLVLALAAVPAFSQTSTAPATVTFTGTPFASSADCRALTIDVNVTTSTGVRITGLNRLNFFIIEGTGTTGGFNPTTATSTQTGYRLTYTTNQSQSFSMRVRVDVPPPLTSIVGVTGFAGVSGIQSVTLSCIPTGLNVSFLTLPIPTSGNCRTFTFDVRVTNDGINVTGLGLSNFFIVESSTAVTGGFTPASVAAITGGYRIVYTTQQPGPSFPLRVRVEQQVFLNFGALGLQRTTFQVGSPTFTLGGISEVRTVTLACESLQLVIDSITRNCAQSQMVVKFSLRGLQLVNREQLQTDFTYTFTEGTATIPQTDFVDFVVDNFTTTTASFTLTYRTRITTVPRFTFRARVARTNGTSAENSQEVEACVVPPPVAGCGTAPTTLTVNRAFSFVAAVTSGGQTPFSWAQVPQQTDISFFQNNLVTVRADGTVTGTPIRQGAAKITVRVTDALQRTSDATCNFNIVPETAPLAVTCGELATVRGVAGQAYSAAASSTGGVGTIRWTLTDASNTFAINASGRVTGTPTVARAFPVTVGVSDSTTPTPATASTPCTITVQEAIPPAPIAQCGGITIAGTQAVAGQLYTATAAVQNGTGQSPFAWSLNANPAAPSWLSVRNAATGEIGGTPPINSAAATVNISLQVRDNQNRTNSVACAFRLVQPPVDVTPSISVTPGANPTTNASAAVRLSGPAPSQLNGRMELTFAPDTVSAIGATDPANPSFVNGNAPDGRSRNFTIAAGSQNFDAPVQVGTTAGVITVRLTSLTRADNNQSFLPANPVVQTITVPRAKPVIQPGSLTLETTPPAGCSASAGAAAYLYIRSAFSNTREITGGTVTFTLASGRTPDGPTAFTLDANNEFRQAFQNWFNSAAGKQNGGAFGVCLPVTLANGTVADIANVTVQLKNGSNPGDSDPVTLR